MNYDEWQLTENPSHMFQEVRMDHLLEDRPFRLFACSICRLFWELLPRSYQHTVEVAEKFADGLIDDRQLETEQNEVMSAIARIPDLQNAYRAEPSVAGCWC